jgi:hypothetical protein
MPKKPRSHTKELALFYKRLASYMGTAPLKQIVAMSNLSPHDPDGDDDRPSITDKSFRDSLPREESEEYFDIEVVPPPELLEFLEGEDGGKMKEDRFIAIEASVVDWMNKHYPLPSWLGYYLESSIVLKESGEFAPMELWITRREHCYAYRK